MDYNETFLENLCCLSCSLDPANESKFPFSQFYNFFNKIKHCMKKNESRMNDFLNLD